MLYNLGIIGGIVFLSKTYGVYGVSIGVAIGAFINMLVQIPQFLEPVFDSVFHPTGTRTVSKKCLYCLFQE